MIQNFQVANLHPGIISVLLYFTLDYENVLQKLQFFEGLKYELQIAYQNVENLKVDYCSKWLISYVRSSLTHSITQNQCITKH